MFSRGTSAHGSCAFPSQGPPLTCLVRRRRKFGFLGRIESFPNARKGCPVSRSQAEGFLGRQETEGNLKGFGAQFSWPGLHLLTRLFVSGNEGKPCVESVQNGKPKGKPHQTAMSGFPHFGGGLKGAKGTVSGLGGSSVSDLLRQCNNPVALWSG